jgi:hypothetical protein
MSKHRKEAKELLAVAARFRGFARETSDVCYRNLFRSGAAELEIEALGYAASNAVAQALRKARAQFHTGTPC